LLQKLKHFFFISANIGHFDFIQVATGCREDDRDLAFDFGRRVLILFQNLNQPLSAG
jgi:hypothetical protein